MKRCVFVYVETPCLLLWEHQKWMLPTCRLWVVFCILYIKLILLGRRGRGVAVLHYFGDALYMSQVHIVPNSGFQLGQVSSIEDEEGENASGENDASDNDGVVEGTEEEGEHVMTVKSGTEDNTSPSDTPIDVSNMHISEANDEPSPPSAEDMDALLLVCLLRALKYIVSVDELPLLVSSLWNTLMR